MSRGSNESEPSPAGTSATEALENAVEESRREYDKKVETMEEIDDKAMRSVRTAVILVGLVVSAVSVSGPRPVGDLSALSILVAAFGVGALTVAVAVGIGVYTVTRYSSGIGSPHRSDVVEGGYSYDEWLVEMLRQHDEWSEEIEDEIDASKRYLEIVQLSLLLGVLALLVAASTVVFELAYGIPPLVSLSAFLLILSLLGSRTF